MNLDQFAAEQAEKREAYRLSRHAWAVAIDWPIPKRRKRNLRPDPGELLLVDDEEG